MGEARRRQLSGVKRAPSYSIRPPRAPSGFKDWLAAQVANPPDERLRLFFQQAWDEMEASNWRAPPATTGEANS
jgi:hypothetical protein